MYIQFMPLMSQCLPSAHDVYYWSSHIKRICCRLAGDATDLSTACLQQVASMLWTCCRFVRFKPYRTDFLATQRIRLQHFDTSICCGQIRWWQNAVDLLATQRICWRFAIETVSQQVYSKSVQCGLSLFVRLTADGRCLVEI
jgi:hypothetical protein